MENKIQCKICGKELKVITNTHLKKHDITVKEYIKKYGNVISNSTRKLLSKKCHFKKCKGKTLEELWGIEIATHMKKKAGWSKGLTKEKDKRVNKMSKTQSLRMRSFKNRIKVSKHFKELCKNTEYKNKLIKRQINRWKDKKYREHMIKKKKEYVFTEEHKKHMSESLKNVVLPEDFGERVSKGLKNSSFDFSKHSKEVWKKRKNNSKEFQCWKNKCLGFAKGQQGSSFPEKQLRKLVLNIFPTCLYSQKGKSLFIKTNNSIRYPDILIEEYKLIIEYDGIKFHSLKNDKKRDKELIEQGYKILHYQGYLPSEPELRNDCKELLSSSFNYKYKRFHEDITLKIPNNESYDKIKQSIVAVIE